MTMHQKILCTWRKLEQYPELIPTVIDDCKRPEANKHIYDLLVMLIRLGVHEVDVETVFDYHHTTQYEPFSELHFLNQCNIAMEHVTKLMNAIYHRSQYKHQKIVNWLFLQACKPFPMEFLQEFVYTVNIKLNRDNCVIDNNLSFIDNCIAYNLIELEFMEYVLNRVNTRYSVKNNVDILIHNVKVSPNYTELEKVTVCNIIQRSYNKHTLLNR